MNIYCGKNEMEIKEDLGSEIHVFPCSHAERIAELEAYVRKAKDWFDRFGEHSPIAFGGEAEMSEAARALLKGGAK